MPRALVIPGVALWLTAAVVHAGVGAPDSSGNTVKALNLWVAAVNTHTPGRADGAVATVAGLTFQARIDLNAGMGMFIAALMSRRLIVTHGDVEKSVAAIGRDLSARPGAAIFLKRAAVLHADAAIYADRFPVPADANAPPPRDPGARADPSTPPLLRNDPLVFSKDGEVLGEVLANWNWPFARSLLDLIRAPGSADDPFVAAWYHATTAYMFGERFYGEATGHLQRAAIVLPDDARILFDRACYAEILGLPEHQVLLPDKDTRLTTGPFSSPAFRPSSDIGVPRAAVTNAEAERLFRRALQVDPSFVEARVRLARLLDLRRRHEEAAAELTTALAGAPTGRVAFYAHLFAGRSAQALGRVDEAAGHFREAVALFPDAQSARLALSQAALLDADVLAALAPVQSLGAGTAIEAADPWWRYALAAGRDSDALLSDLWTRVPR